MHQYLFIETRDPFEVPDVEQVHELAEKLTKEGDEVTLYLVQNAVLAARSGHSKTTLFEKLSASGKVKILVDDYSLAERGIEKEEINPAIMKISNMENLVDLLMVENQRAIWC